MKKEGRQSGIPNMIAVAGIVTAAVLFTGCNYFIDKADKMAEDTTTTRYWEYTTTTTTTIPETETETTEPETTVTYETMPVTTPVAPEAFANIDSTYSIDAIVSEVGPYARFECTGFYVWTVNDGSEVWVRPDEENHVSTLLSIRGLDHELLYGATELDISRYSKSEGGLGYSYTVLPPREFGPDLEYGWYILEENGSVYILVSTGRVETRGEYLFVHRIKYTRYIAVDTFIVTTDRYTYEGTEELPQYGPYTTPLCGIKMDEMPDLNHFSMIDIYRCALPFKGYLSDSKTWQVIDTELFRETQPTTMDTGSSDPSEEPGTSES